MVSKSGSRVRPVLMMPLRRCGSHAIRLRLACNPAFYSPYPLHVVDFMPLVGHYGELDDRSYFQLVQDLIGFQNANVVKWPGVAFDPVTVFEAAAGKPRSVHAVLWEMLMQAAEQHGASVVMDKSCESVQFAEECLALLPELRFLNVVRDPRAQVNSINRSIILDFDSLLNARRWVSAHDMARALAERYPERVLTIRFEDFITTPGPVLLQVCEFLGIEYMDAMLDIAASSEARRLSRLSALWESNDRPPIRANIDKFTQQLGLDEIEVIETLAADHMRHYGYELMTSANAQLTDDDVERARHRSAAARERAWSELRERDPRDYQLRRYRAWYLESVRERLVRGEAVAATR